MQNETVIRQIIANAKNRDWNVTVLADEKGNFIRKSKQSENSELPANDYVVCHLNLGGSKKITTTTGKEKVSFKPSENRNFTVVFFDATSEKRNVIFKAIKNMLDSKKFELINKTTKDGKETGNAELEMTLPGKMIEFFVPDYHVIIDGKKQANPANSLTVFIIDDDVDGYMTYMSEYKRRILPNLVDSTPEPSHSVTEEA